MHCWGVGYFILLFFSPPGGSAAPCGPTPPYFQGFAIILRHATLSRSPSEGGVSVMQRPLPDNTHKPDVLTPGGIQNRSLGN